MIRFWTTLLLLFSLTIVTMGCESSNHYLNTDHATSSEEIVILTGVYKVAERFVMPEDDDAYRYPQISYYDAEAGTLSVLVYERDEGPADNVDNSSSWEQRVRLRIETCSPDGTLVSSVSLPDEVLESKDSESGGRLSFWDGFLTADRLIWLTVNTAPDGLKITLHTCGTDGMGLVETDFQMVLSSPVSSLNYLAQTDSLFAALPNGTTAISAGEEITVLNSALEKQFGLTSPGQVVALGFTPAGDLLFGTGENERCKTFYRIDPATHQPVSVRNFTENDPLNPGVRVFFGAGFDYYYQEDRQGLPRGIYGCRAGEEGTILLVDGNSGLGKSLRLCSVIDTDTLLYLAEKDGAPITVEIVRHAPDIELDNIQTLEIAVCVKNRSEELEMKLTQYSTTHPDCRLLIVDKTDKEDFVGNADKLSFDLANGFYQPDIIWTESDSRSAQTMIEKNLYVDLAPYMDADPVVNRSNLFVSVRNVFEAKDGGIWGLAPEFTVSTIIGRRDVLGKYAEKGSWTVAEFVEFAASLPPDVLLGRYLTQYNYRPMLGMNAFNKWIDYENASCHFEDKDFKTFLAFFKTLPKDWNDIKARYTFTDKLSAGSLVINSEPYQLGQIALLSGDIVSINQLFYGIDVKMGTFGTDDLIYIGCPSPDGKQNNVLHAKDSFIISKSCADPDRAWDVIRCLMEPGAEEIDASRCFPSLKSIYESVADEMEKYWYKIEADDLSVSSWPKGWEDGVSGFDADDLALITMTEEKRAKIRDWLDTAVEVRMVDSTPSEIVSIIAEEISEMLSRNTGETDCAKKIQSRVSIWLAEHK